MDASLSGVDITIERTVKIDPCRPMFDIEYEFEVASGEPGDQTGPLRLIQYCDFDVDPPDKVGYERTLTFDDSPDIVTRDGYPYVDGRTVHRTPAVVGDEQTPAMEHVPVDVEPGTLNVNSEGKFATAWLGIGDQSPGALVLESIVMNRVQAVTDDTYGFVENPPTRTRNGETQVMVEFPKEEVIEQLTSGTQTVRVSGLAGGVSVSGTDELRVADPGRGNSGKGKSR
jgi:hypothetical protein